MKSLLCFLVLLLLCSSSFSQTTNDYGDSALNGIWWNVTYNKTPAYMQSHYNYLKGAFPSFKWSDLETSPGVYNWTATNGFDSTLNGLAAAGFKICLIIYTGPATPSWVYKGYNVDSLRSNTGNVYPDYLNSPNYLTRWRLMLDSVFHHITTMNTAVKNNFVLYQSAEGATGDEVPFHDARVPSDSTWPYSSSSTLWMAFRDTAWAWTNRELKSYFPSSRLNGSTVTLLVNPSNDSAQISNYTSFLFSDTTRKLNHTWLKAGNIGHGYQLNTEATTKAQYDPYINKITPAGSGRTLVRSRSEMDEFNGWFTEKPKWSYYWLALSALHFGLDCWMTSWGSMVDTNYNSAFPLFAKYAGLKDPSKSTKGFCALRDGLDASDFTRFPTGTYGTGTIDNYSTASPSSRASKIIAAFSSYGANQEDDTAANGAPMKQRNSDSLNDVGWGIFTGNYERFIKQVNLPTGLYRGGYWRRGPFVGTAPLLQPTDPYGRFAKGFDSVNSITNLYFDINDSLILDSNANGTKTAMIKITYLDSGLRNTWSLIYYTKTGSGAPTPVTKTITNTNASGTVSWKTDTTLVNNLYIKVGVTSTTADLQLQKGAKSARQVFHLIEISNQPGSANFNKREANDNLLPLTANTSTGITLYPNPGKGRFTVQWKESGFNESAIVRVLNSEGKPIYVSGAVTGGRAEVNIQSKPAGVYYVEVRRSKDVLSTKFIKE